MIEQKRCAVSGVVDTDLETIKSKICSIIHERLGIADIGDSQPCDTDSTMKSYLSCKTITLNSKNIEYTEEFHLSDRCVPCKEVIDTLKKLDAIDIAIVLTVYRLGQYSYYMAEPYLVREYLGTC